MSFSLLFLTKSVTLRCTVSLMGVCQLLSLSPSSKSDQIWKSYPAIKFYEYSWKIYRCNHIKNLLLSKKKMKEEESMKFITGLWSARIQDGCSEKPCYLVSYVSTHYKTANMLIHPGSLMCKERGEIHDLWLPYDVQQAVQHFTGSADSPGRVCQN